MCNRSWLRGKWRELQPFKCKHSGNQWLTITLLNSMVKFLYYLVNNNGIIIGFRTKFNWYLWCSIILSLYFRVKSVFVGRAKCLFTYLISLTAKISKSGSLFLRAPRNLSLASTGGVRHCCLERCCSSILLEVSVCGFEPTHTEGSWNSPPSCVDALWALV